MPQNTKQTSQRPVTRIYIDGANLYKGLKSETEELDYAKFYKYLKDRHHPQTIYLFMGHIASHKPLYDFLEEIGYSLIFKETYQNNDGEIKGNVDGELIIKSLEELYEDTYDQGVLVSGDGDFSCLIDFWKRKNIKPKVLAPTKEYCSYFLRKQNISLTYLDDPDIFIKIKKTLCRDVPQQRFFFILYLKLYIKNAI